MEKKLPPVPKSPSNHFKTFARLSGKRKTRSPFEIGDLMSGILFGCSTTTESETRFRQKTKRIT